MTTPAEANPDLGPGVCRPGLVARPQRTRRHPPHPPTNAGEGRENRRLPFLERASSTRVVGGADRGAEIGRRVGESSHRPGRRPASSPNAATSAPTGRLRTDSPEGVRGLEAGRTARIRRVWCVSASGNHCLALPPGGWIADRARIEGGNSEPAKVRDGDSRGASREPRSRWPPAKTDRPRDLLGGQAESPRADPEPHEEQADLAGGNVGGVDSRVGRGDGAGRVSLDRRALGPSSPCSRAILAVSVRKAADSAAGGGTEGERAEGLRPWRGRR